MYRWSEREQDDIRADRLRFAADLFDSIDRRVAGVTSQDHIATLEVFDAVKLVSLQCGKRENDVITREIGEPSYEEYGVKEIKKLMRVVAKMRHVVENKIDFDLRLAHRYMMSIKDAIAMGIWNGLCPDWFIVQDTNKPLKLNAPTKIQELHQIEGNKFESEFQISTSEGKIVSCRLHDQSVYASFYSNEEIYSVATMPGCILIDVALAKGGPEAIAESFYATMRAQQQVGGQYNDTLVTRTKLSWALPSVRLCDDILRESIKLYFKGDNHIKAHRSTIFFSSRATKYSTSKVIDRVDAEKGRCPFLVE